MFQPVRESWLALATKRAASLALAGIAAGIVAVTGSGASRPTQDVSGLARVIDGDTIAIGEARIRLEGIDAPEIEQTCGTPGGTSWACGEVAIRHLARQTAGQIVRCTSKGNDIYGRTLGVCWAGNVELNADMVQRGLAWAFVKYSRTYVDLEAQARAMKVGIWSGPAQAAWEFRAAKWDGSTTAAPRGCPIKGNISRHGHIYHLPWDPYYSRTTIDALRGERWFCSENEAIAAGFRHAGLH